MTPSDRVVIPHPNRIDKSAKNTTLSAKDLPTPITIQTRIRFPNRLHQDKPHGRGTSLSKQGGHNVRPSDNLALVSMIISPHSSQTRLFFIGAKGGTGSRGSPVTKISSMSEPRIRAQCSCLSSWSLAACSEVIVP